MRIFRIRISSRQDYVIVFYIECRMERKQYLILHLPTLRHKNPTYFVGFLLCSETVILHDAVHRAACGVNPGSPKCPQVKKRKGERFSFDEKRGGCRNNARKRKR